MNDSSQQTSNYYVNAAIICSIPLLFYVFEFTIRVVPSVITSELMHDFNIGAAGVSIMSALFYYGYSLMQIPVGLLYDRMRAKILLTTATAVASFSTLLFTIAGNIYLADLAYFLIGLSGAFGFIGTLVLASRWYPAKYFALIAGLVQFSGSLAAVIGQQPIALLVQKIGWRQSVGCICMFGFVLFMLTMLLLRDKPQNYQQPKSKAKYLTSTSGEFSRLKLVIKNSQNWLTAIYSFSSWTPMVVFVGLWGIPFLMLIYQMSAATAALAIATAWIGNAIASPFVGWWSSHLQRRCIPLIVCSFIGLVTSLLVIYGSHISWPIMCVLLFFFGFSAAGQALSFGVVQDNNPAKVAGTATGFNNMAVIFSGVILQPIVGLIMKLHWNGEMLNNVPVYTLSTYHIALVVVPLSSVLGLVVSLFFLKETHCKSIFHADHANQHKAEVISNGVINS